MRRLTISAGQARHGVERRTMLRTALGIPARMTSVVDVQECVLVDVSLSGALVCVPRPLTVDACGYLRAGSIEAFAIAVRVSPFGETTTAVGVRFDERLTKAQIMYLRSYAAQRDLFEKRALRSAVRDWVRGDA
ncbi:MAG: hypothetical protein GC147_06680 [Porphyrobacter sp.]|nr:hypothetical protein [Porphyrobacter sp.]